MKKLIILLIFALPLGAIAQNRTKPAPKKKEVKTFPIDSITNKINYTKQIELKDRSKESIYARLKNFVTDPKNVIKDDKEKGILSYKGQYSVKYPSPMVGITHSGLVHYEVYFTYKDGEYSYSLTNLTHTGQQADGGALEGKKPACDEYLLTLAGWGNIKNQALKMSEEIVNSIETTLQLP